MGQFFRWLRLFKGGTSWVGQPGSLLVFSSSFVIYLAIYLFKFDVFEMDTLAIESLRSGTFITVKKLNIGHLYCSLLFVLTVDAII